MLFQMAASVLAIAGAGAVVPLLRRESPPDRVPRARPPPPSRPPNGFGKDTGTETFVISSKKPVLHSTGSQPNPNQRQFYDFDIEAGKYYYRFNAWSPGKYEVCADPAPGNTGPLTSCDMLLTIDAPHGWLNKAHLRFTDTCYDDALIDHAYLVQWEWEECSWWQGCGFDGGYWKDGPDIDWGVSHNGFSWCLGDDLDAWKKYSLCGFQCLQDCGEGHWVPSKKCDPDMVFHKNGHVTYGSP